MGCNWGLASKGFWAEMLGVGDFYYELGIQVVESCLIWQEMTGGLTDISIVKQRITRIRGGGNAAAPVSEYVFGPCGVGHELLIDMQ